MFFGYTKRITCKFLTLVVLMTIPLNCLVAQNNQAVTDISIFWQQGTIIHFEDFNRTVDSIGIQLCKKYDVQSMSNIQIYVALDYPKNAKKIKKLKEKLYFAPCFCKDCSIILSKDSFELKINQLYFDAAEFCTRKARMRIKELENMNMGNGFVAAATPGLVDRTYKEMEDFFSDIAWVLKTKNYDDYEKLRNLCNTFLASTTEFATSMDECFRFINGKPYSDEYVESYVFYGKRQTKE